MAHKSLELPDGAVRFLTALESGESGLVPLPIDAHLPEIAEAMSLHHALVIEAPPGAGKTTRVPNLFLSLFASGDIVVLEPRRLSAHLSAARVAEERGERLGDTVGVQMRFQTLCGPNTRLRYVTEGVLVRQLQSEPTLRGVSAVVLDELHERHLASDLSLALLRRLQRGVRPDLKLCAMSATMDSDRVAAFLGNCPIVRSTGRAFPVEIEYVNDLADEPLWRRVRGALRRTLKDSATDDGDVLIFLPGSSEIRRCQEELVELSEQHKLDVLPLHGDLPFENQRQAVTPRRAGARRKVILSTNVAETSLTIDGVTTVIDSGLARVAGHSPWSGLPTLRVQPISRAQATQRAGRAGRTRKGRCLRLYTRLDHDARPEYELPEISRSDLCELVLTLAATQLESTQVDFLDMPPPAALTAARQTLSRLGALEPPGELTPLGRRLIELPLHPRLGRLLCAAADEGLAVEGAILTALIGERDLRLGRSGLGNSGDPRAAHVHGPSDVLHLYDLYLEARNARFNRSSLARMDLDADVAQAVERVSGQLLRALRRDGTRDKPAPRTDAAIEAALLRAILFAYPDRVARRRNKSSGAAPEFVLGGGGSAVLSPSSVVREAEWVVLVDVEERASGRGAPSRTLIRLASAIDPSSLLDLPGDALRETNEPLWNAENQRVEVSRRLQFEQLVLDESRAPGDGQDEAQIDSLCKQALAASPLPFADADELPRLAAKLDLLREQLRELALPPFDAETIAKAVRELCRGHTSFAELRSLSLIDAVLTPLEAQSQTRSLRGELHRLLPEHITLAAGRRVRVHYEAGKPPWIESRLQDFFGMHEGPRLLQGRLPLVLHLLAPNQRAVQVTTDLAGFWSRHYPAIRRELCRRYPRHAWPENPSG